MPAPVHIGVGGWDYEPWRGAFYPPGLPRAQQLEFAARRFTATEVNATFYRLQKPETWAKWAAMVPAAFRFAVKGSRFCTNRRNLAEAGEAVGRFCAQGLAALGDRLGPINWQLMPTKRFDADEIAAFLALLPPRQDGLALRHALEVRHESFSCPEFLALARAAGVAVVVADNEDYPQLADLTADFVYARLRRTREDEPAGYAPAELDRWARVIQSWRAGESPAGLDYVAKAVAPAPAPREVFAFVIAGFKVRNPAAAQALIARVEGQR